MVGQGDGVKGKDPLKLKLKAFCLFSYKEAPKVKDLGPKCLRLSASCSHDQTLLLVNGVS